ncbi:tRNA3(Ser)-specific nuclease WapA [Halioglobus japonicus]|nr:tRNA3(Ser)-specific nuclease WapA [Halioglobus japonicus]
MFRTYEMDFRRGLLARVGTVMLAIAAIHTHAQSDVDSPISLQVSQKSLPVHSTALPGWVAPIAERVSPDEALRILGTGADVQERSAPQAKAAFATPGDYAALAEALENDPLRIFQYVHNHFEYVPYFGLLKGPYLTLHERSGNDFDQAALLVELLRAAGIPARYQFGKMSASGAAELQAVADWLGTDADVQIIANTLTQGGVPVIASDSTLSFSRIWVQATIGPETVLLDPAFKRSTRFSTINLSNAMNYAESELLAAAGGTNTAVSIKAMNWQGLSEYLTDRATDLQNYLKLNHPNDRVEDVLGGFRIVPDNGDSLPSGLALPVLGSPVSWEAVPANYIHTLQLTYGGIDITSNIPDIAGRKVSLSYSDVNISFPPPDEDATNFGALFIGAEGSTQIWTGTNETGETIQLVAALTGSGSSAFQITNGAGSQTIKAGKPFSVHVQFVGSGQSVGRKNATLSLKYYRQGSPIGDEVYALTGVVEPERVASLYIDDQLEAGELAATGDRSNLRLAINHPYVADQGEFADQTRDFKVKPSGTYVIVSAFGGDKHSTLLSERQRLLNRMSVDGTAPDAPERLSETLNVIGQTWMQQTQLNSDLLYTLSGKRSIRHHRFGIAGQEEGYFVDMAAQTASVVDRVVTPKSDAFRAQSFVASAMEHSVLDQLQGVVNDGSLTNPAVSTIRLFALTNYKGDRLFVANNSNYSSISSQLRNYSSDQLKHFKDLVAKSHTLVLPEDGVIEMLDWSGHAYVDINDSSQGRYMGMIIGGGLSGGKGTTPSTASPLYVMREFLPEIGIRKNVPITPAGDPVDLGTGAFVSSLTDFGVAGAGTRGFAFTRSYNSQMASEDAVGLGRGWTHNYNIHLSRHSDVEAALGARTVFDAVPMVVVNEITRQLLQASSPTPRQWGVAALVANWGMDQLLNKSVTVQMGSKAMTYQEMPNGEFIPPAGETSKLVRTGATYKLQERFGTVWKFNADDRIASITDVDGMAMTFLYNASGKLTQVKDAYSRSLFLKYTNDDLVQAYDSLYHSVNYDKANGNLIKVNGLENSNWTYGYDNLQRLETVRNPVGVQIVDNTYNDFDRVVEQKAPRDTGLETYKMHYGGVLSSEEDPEGNRITYHFDLDGRRVAVEDAMGHTTRVAYDGQGQTVQQTDPLGNLSTSVYDADNNLVEQIDAQGNRLLHIYDGRHRLIQTRDPLRHKVNFEYDAKHHLIGRTDDLGNKVQSTYLANGLVENVFDPRTTQTHNTYDAYGYPRAVKTGGHPDINWNYNIRGELESFVDQAGAITTFTYDQRGLLKSRKDARGKVSSRVYTPAGKLKKLTDRLNRSTYFTYTDSGKVNVVRTPLSTVDFNYDARDNLVEMIDPTGTTTNTHDAAGRLTSHTDSNGHTVSYAYDAAGNLTTLTYPPGNKRIKYTYDNLNRISTVTIDWLSGKPTMRYVYDAASRLDRVEHFNAMETSYTWDDANRLTGIAHEGATSLVEYNFLLDANGNRVSETISPEPLIPGNPVSNDISFAYNFQRNRLNNTSTHSYAYGSEGQLTDTIGTVRNRFTYDNEGQLAGKDTVDYTFDDAHRLVQRGDDSFVYDGVGNRLKAIRNGRESQYIYDAAGNLLAGANSSGQITRYYIYGAGLTAMASGGTYYVYHFDGTGHTVALTNASNEVINKYAYSPYGKLVGEEQSINQPFKYAGQVGIYTEDDNLYYMRARYYDAEVGRFISEDPAGFVDGSNLYAYVGGNPIGTVDPTGLYAGYGSGPYSSYYATKRSADAAGREDYAKVTSTLGDALTIATPLSGPFAPHVGTVATGVTILSAVLDPSENLLSGSLALAVESAATILLRRVQIPLELTEATLAAAKGLIVTPVALANIANRVSGQGSVCD